MNGVYSLAEELTPKRLSLLKEIVPSAQRIGVLLRDDWPNAKLDWQTAEAAAKQRGLSSSSGGVTLLGMRRAESFRFALSTGGPRGEA